MKQLLRKKKGKNNMKNTEINFEDYAPLNKNYSKIELADIYKKIILDIEKTNKI